VDTAGAREALDVVEREGVARGDQAREIADVVVLVFDGSEPLTLDDETLLERTRSRCRILVVNKADRQTVVSVPGAIRLSATRGDGLDELRTAIRVALTGSEPLRDTAVLSNMRHVELLGQARDFLDRARVAATEDCRTEEFILVDLQAARERFDAVVGHRTADDVLQHIFERFCIGK
jgi:tRNA modification GTPase